MYALVGGMLARYHTGPGYVGVVYHLNFARWGLEGAFFLYALDRLHGRLHSAALLNCSHCAANTLQKSQGLAVKGSGYEGTLRPSNIGILQHGDPPEKSRSGPSLGTAHSE